MTINTFFKQKFVQEKPKDLKLNQSYLFSRLKMMYLTNHKSKSHRQPCTIQQKTRNDQRHCKNNQIEKRKNMYLWFFKKVNIMVFPYVLHDVVLHDVLFVWINLCFICPLFHPASTTSFVSASFCFVQATMAHCMLEPSSSCILMFCPLLKIL